MLETDARCRDCGYTLKGLPSGECPECGRPFDWNKRTTYRLGDEPTTLGALWVVRKHAFTRLMIIFLPGLAFVIYALAGGLDLSDWGCVFILVYPFWVVVCTVYALACLSPMGLLGVVGAMLLGVVVALPFYALFGAWLATLAVPTGLVAGLVFKHMELNNML